MQAYTFVRFLRVLEVFRCFTFSFQNYLCADLLFILLFVFCIFVSWVFLGAQIVIWHWKSSSHIWISLYSSFSSPLPVFVCWHRIEIFLKFYMCKNSNVIKMSLFPMYACAKFLALGNALANIVMFILNDLFVCSPFIILMW